jgi:hypothetical protein
MIKDKVQASLLSFKGFRNPGLGGGTLLKKRSPVPVPVIFAGNVNWVNDQLK